MRKAWTFIFGFFALVALGCCIISAVWVPVVFICTAMAAAAWYDLDPRNTEEDGL